MLLNVADGEGVESQAEVTCCDLDCVIHLRMLRPS